MAISADVRAAVVDRRATLTGAGAVGAAAVAGLSGALASFFGRAVPSVALPAAAGAAAGGAGTVGALAGAAAVAETVKVSIQVNKTALVSQLYAYFADPSPTSRKQRPVVDDFTSSKKLGIPYQLLEAVVIEGDLTREDVDEFVSGLLDGRENVEVVG